MTARAAKLERRDLRRTLGDVGLTLVENQGIALEKQVMPSLRALTEISKDTDHRLSEWEAFRMRTLRQRIAWVLFGD